MTRFLREWVFNNWSLKLLALGISFLLWFTYTAEPAAEVGYMVPLEFRDIPPELEISGDLPAQVQVRLRGRSALLRRLVPGDVELRLDLKSAHVGDNSYRLDPEQVVAPYGAAVVRINPLQIRVLLVPRRSSPAAP